MNSIEMLVQNFLNNKSSHEPIATFRKTQQIRLAPETATPLRVCVRENNPFLLTAFLWEDEARAEPMSPYVSPMRLSGSFALPRTTGSTNKLHNVAVTISQF